MMWGARWLLPIRASSEWMPEWFPDGLSGIRLDEASLEP